MKPIDVEVFSVKLGALHFSETHLAIGTILQQLIKAVTSF